MSRTRSHGFRVILTIRTWNPCMSCPYCKSELSIASDARPCIARCETCQRHILFFRGIFGLRFSTSELRVPLPTAIMMLGACGLAFSVLLSVLVPYLLGLPGIWVDALGICPYVAIVIILNLGYEGYLSVQTGILKHKRSLIRGRWAILSGLIQICLSIFVLAFLYATFGSIIP
jgi:hypothetical protein